MNTLKNNIDDYIKYMTNRNYSANTIKNYEINLRYYYSFCKNYNIDYINIKGSNMIKYIDTMTKYKPSTINLRLSVLKGFYNYLIDIDVVNLNPVRQSLYIRHSRKKPRPLSAIEERKFYTYIENKDEHIRLAFKVLLETGIRVSELKKLTLSNVQEINNKYYIEVLESKNEGSRIVPISFELYQAMLSYAESNVFYGNLFVLSIRAYQFHADSFSKKYNIRFSVHSLRHTYATRKSQEGLPIQIIQKLLGHKNITTTMYYVEVSDIDILNL